jgi:hypothetical protein
MGITPATDKRYSTRAKPWHQRDHSADIDKSATLIHNAGNT